MYTKNYEKEDWSGLSEKDRILVICAHPDDETLGVGGTIALHAERGEEVFVLIFATGQFARDDSKKGIEERQNQGKRACSILGTKAVKFLNYADQKLDMVPVVELAGQIESVMKIWSPNTIYTHHWGDVNQDHRKIFEAALIASRPTPSSKIKRFVCFETPSSTEWGNTKDKFNPNLFIKIDESILEKKLQAVREYEKEVNPYPHPRSEESIINRCKYWGSGVGVKYAEALFVMREIME